MDGSHVCGGRVYGSSIYRKRVYWKRFLRSPVVLGSILFSQVLLVQGAGQAASFSPDDQRVVFTWSPAPGKMDLFTAQSDGSKFQPVPGGEGGIAPTWSPDGRRILFATKNPGSSVGSMKLYDTESGQVTTIVENAEPPLVWRQDHIRFGGIRHEDDGLHLYLYDLQGGGKFMDVPLPGHTVLPHDATIAWVPDSDQIAVISESNVYLMEQGQVKPITTSHDVIGVGVSSDGKGIVWARREAGPQGPVLTLYRFDLAARSAEKLKFPSGDLVTSPDLPGRSGGPEYVAFSPDGKKLAEVVTRTVAPPKPWMTPVSYRVVYTAGIDGSYPRAVAHAAIPTPQKLPKPTAQDGQAGPDSPTGSGTDPHGSKAGPAHSKPGPASSKVGSAGGKADTANSKASTAGSKPAAPTVISSDHLIPFWSSDGKRLAISDVGDHPSLYIYSAGGSIRIAPHAVPAPPPPKPAAAGEKSTVPPLTGSHRTRRRRQG